ncbi:MAG: nuclear transport factor 2 family protein [Cyclobacteriaceae bacterium]|nr:nuclear transport factor 2 family protein [Cyclobacteriaceae bacterium]
MKALPFLLILLICTLANGQSDDDAVMKPISQLFTGMNLGDSAMVRGAFAKEVTMGSITKDKSGNPMVRKSELADFLKAVGTPHPDPWSEPIWGTKISVDGNLAQVWTKYAFYLGKKFNHCGVDAFHLIYDGKEWKIFHLVDTRQTADCNIPAAISNQFK